MTREDLKHALISLILGVLITAGSSIIIGLLHIAQLWLSGLAGGMGTTTVYIYKHFHLS